MLYVYIYIYIHTHPATTCMFSAITISETWLTYHQLNPYVQISINLPSKYEHFLTMNTFKMASANSAIFFQAATY